MRVPHGLARLVKKSGFQDGTISNRPKQLQEDGPSPFVIGHFIFIICHLFFEKKLFLADLRRRFN